MRRRFAELTAPFAQRDFRTLFLAQLISGLGDWAGRLALTVLVYERSSSPVWAATVTAVSLLPWLGIGQLLASYADRYGRISVMVTTDLARAVLFGAMLLGPPVPVLLGLAFLAGLGSPPFAASRAAATVDIVPPERYGDALAIGGIGAQVELLIGYAAGGVLISAVGATSALAVNTMSFLVSAALLLRLRRSAAAARHRTDRTAAHRLRVAVQLWWRDRWCRRALSLAGFANATCIVPEALVVPFADTAGFGPSVGWLAASIPAGAALGMAFAPSRGSPRELLVAAANRALVPAVGAAVVLALTGPIAMALAAYVLVGAVTAVAVPTNQVVGHRLPQDGRAVAMSVAVGFFYSTQAAVAVIAGLAAQAWDASVVVAGAMVVSAAGLAVAVLRPPPRDPFR